MFPVGGPTRTGFQIDSVENYRGKITVEAYSGLLHDRLEERLEIANAAIEFGGDARCKQTKEATEVPVVQAEATLAAAGPADTAIPEKRIRRELRALSEEERERVFAAMNVMKQTSSLKGQKMFGPQFISYDDLVAQHLKAAATKGCDEAQLGMSSQSHSNWSPNFSSAYSFLLVTRFFSQARSQVGRASRQSPYAKRTCRHSFPFEVGVG